MSLGGWPPSNAFQLMDYAMGQRSLPGSGEGLDFFDDPTALATSLAPGANIAPLNPLGPAPVVSSAYNVGAPALQEMSNVPQQTLDQIGPLDELNPFGNQKFFPGSFEADQMMMTGVNFADQQLALPENEFDQAQQTVTQAKKAANLFARGRDAVQHARNVKKVADVANASSDVGSLLGNLSAQGAGEAAKQGAKSGVGQFLAKAGASKFGTFLSSGVGAATTAGAGLLGKAIQEWDKKDGNYSKAGAMGGGALQGAAIGSALGPLGTIAGAGIGAAVGAAQKKKFDKQAIYQDKVDAADENAKKASLELKSRAILNTFPVEGIKNQVYAHGGEHDPTKEEVLGQVRGSILSNKSGVTRDLYKNNPQFAAMMNGLTEEEYNRINDELRKAMQLEGMGFSEALDYGSNVDLTFIQPIRERAGISKSQLIDGALDAAGDNLSWAEKVAIKAAAKLKNFAHGGEHDPIPTGDATVPGTDVFAELYAQLNPEFAAQIAEQRANTPVSNDRLTSYTDAEMQAFENRAIAERGNEATQQVVDNVVDFHQEKPLDALGMDLAILGQVPVIGEAADIANAGISGVRSLYNYAVGDTAKAAEQAGLAGLSLTAAIPFIGNAAGASRIAHGAHGLAHGAHNLERGVIAAKGVKAGNYTAKKALGGHTNDPDYLAEGGEMIQHAPGDLPKTDNNGSVTPVTKTIARINGDKHTAPSGGVGMEGKESARIYSDQLYVPADLVAQLSKL